MIPVPSNVVSAGAALWVALFASGAAAEIPQAAFDAQIVVLGEQHDNPDHHARQAAWVAALEPKALVFEMLTERQAVAANGPWETQDGLDAATGWSETSWPAFAMYFPIFDAARDAVIYGAGVPRPALRAQLETPLATHPLAAKFGLDQPADPEEQLAREELQAQAHCDALPEEMLPVMVNAQRIRDAALADAALRALDHTGGPVVVITGNGHARADWGMPALLAHAAPDVPVFALAQGEDGGAVGGAFSLTLDAPAPVRGDPCAAFTQ
ncbi:ChaN family lipoprotein [uncultured Sulfitobacter sp.]|uniref:ChaN family lipoprotein n=1 Tax=uncultured Sulfitobacter sp. TaxID=191468 RepID=UPI0026141EB7|nr:ChaN family lipoprotein [uncultured Sulfitobacter sp.]